MKYLPFIVLLLTSISTLSAEILKEGPFEGVDLSKLDANTARILKEANEDFVRVLEFKKPKYAEFNSDAPLPLDGGTKYWTGYGYHLTVLKSISTFGELHGYIYGPIIEFWDDFAPGNTNKVECLKFHKAPLIFLNIEDNILDANNKSVDVTATRSAPSGTSL